MDEIDKEKNKEMSRGLREQAFKFKYNDLEKFKSVGDYGLYGVIIEMGYEKGFATIACFTSGDASIYFSTGGGYIGGVGKEPIKNASLKLVNTALNFVTDFRKTEQYPAPKLGQTNFYLLTKDGLLWMEAKTSEFRPNGPHPLTPLFAAGQDVITAYRLIDKKPVD